MPAPLTIVIPTLNAQAELPDTLASLMPGIECGLIARLIVVDGGSVDATVPTATDAGADVIPVQSASRGGQLRAGADAVSGPWMMFLHADTHLPDGWTDLASDFMARGQGAACFRLGFRAAGFGARWTAGWANWRSRIFGLPYGDQALLIHSDLYAAVGGYPEQPLMEDVALARRLKGQITILPAAVQTGADKYLAQGWFTRGRKNLWLLVRYLLGADPQELVRAYVRPRN